MPLRSAALEDSAFAMMWWRCGPTRSSRVFVQVCKPGQAREHVYARDSCEEPLPMLSLDYAHKLPPHGSPELTIAISNSQFPDAHVLGGSYRP